MPSHFLSSEEYDERAHQQYNEGNYDAALDTLREGLTLYPAAVELHVGVGYARLARDEFAWARRCFEEALVLDPDHEDALAGLGETLLKFGRRDGALKAFQRILELGYQDDVELMLQVARVLFRDELLDDARQFVNVARQQAPENTEALALLGYIDHRAGNDAEAIATLRRVLRMEPEHTEARVYLANVLYDRGDFDGARYHFGLTKPDDHWDELGIWRMIELMRANGGAADAEAIKPWEARLEGLTAEDDTIDEMLGEIEQRVQEEDSKQARDQLELFGAMLASLAGDKGGDRRTVAVRDGREYEGTWDEIVELMRADSTIASRDAAEFMQQEARRGFSLTGALISTADAESFLRDCADAGMLRIVG